MNSIMRHTAVQANDFYRHKKFDQGKHIRSDSTSLTSSDGDLRNDLGIEGKIHPFLNLSHFNWPVLETKSKKNVTADSKIDQQLPAAKRSCNFSVDHYKPYAKTPQSFTVSPATQLNQANILQALEKGIKRRFTPDGNTNQRLPLAKRPCATASITPNTDQYAAVSQQPYSNTATSNSLQHLSSAQRPFTTNLFTNSSTITSDYDQCVVPAPGTNNSYVSTRMPAIEKKAQRNLPTVANTDQNMAPPTRPRSFSASASRSAYPLLRLTQLPLNNMPLALMKPTNIGPTPDSSTNQQPTTTSSQKPCAYTLASASYQHTAPIPGRPSSSFTHLTQPGNANILPDLAKERKTKFAATLNTNQDITPIIRQRSFSAGTGSLAYSMQPQWTNTPLDLKKQLNRGFSPASNTSQQQSPAQTRPLNCSADTRSRSSSFGMANILTSSLNKESKSSPTTALNTEQNMDPATRPRSFSASTSSSASSFASLTELCRANTSIPLPVIPPPTDILPKISQETIRDICKYHGNMVRKFPKKERTPKDQERRNKNTIACRMSRRVKKLEHIAIEEQYKEFKQKTFEIVEKSMRAAAYLHELMKLCKSPEGETKSLAESTKTERLPTILQQKKPFTVAFLAGKEEK